jgi:deoxyadenosine/deoxycytidine kinase
MLVVVVGPIASGKSTVAASLGASLRSAVDVERIVGELIHALGDDRPPISR